MLCTLAREILHFLLHWQDMRMSGIFSDINPFHMYVLLSVFCVCVCVCVCVHVHVYCMHGVGNQCFRFSLCTPQFITDWHIHKHTHPSHTYTHTYIFACVHAHLGMLLGFALGLFLWAYITEGTG